MPIHVAHIVESFASGCLTAVATLCHTVHDVRHSVIYSVRPETPCRFTRLFPDNVDFYHTSLKLKSNPIPDITVFARLYQTLRAVQPDVIHCHSSTAGFVGRFVAPLLGLPSVYTPHAYAFLRSDVAGLARACFKAAEWIAARLGSAVIACGQEEYDIALMLTPHPDKVFLVSNAVKLDYLDAIANTVAASKASHAAHGEKILVGTCGRLGPQHDPALFSALADALNDKTTWVWIGAMKESRTPLPPQVERTGWLERDEALALVAGLDIYVHTTLWDGLSIAVLEAMALGKPVVATDIPANRAVVKHGVTGFLGSGAEELAAHIDRLANDAELRQRIGQSARQYVSDHHDAMRNSSKYSDIYHALTANRPAT